MAHKGKKKKAGPHRRRKKMSGTAEIQEFVLRAIAVTAGGLTSAFGIQAANTALAKQAMPTWVVPAGFAGLGLAVPYFDKKEPLIMDFGMGMFVVGCLMAVNETFLSVPGISGMAMTSNSPNSNVMQKALGCKNGQQMKVGAGPGNYLNQTVGARRNTRARRLGALITD
jgi:hypothetical protein